MVFSFYIYLYLDAYAYLDSYINTYLDAYEYLDYYIYTYLDACVCNVLLTQKNRYNSTTKQWDYHAFICFNSFQVFFIK